MAEQPEAGPGRMFVRQGRGIFVALHLFAVTVMALPSVGSGMHRAAWETPTVQDEFAAWTARLNGLGIAIEQPALEDALWEVAQRYEAGRDAILWPFQPYYRYLGTWQSWKMFVAPHRYPGRLEIEIDDGRGGWRTVYLGRSSEHEWLRPWLDHDRFRAAVFRYSWAHYRGPRRQFADWAARLAAEEWPRAQRFRLSFLRYKTLSPEEVKAGAQPKTRRELVNERDLAEFR